MNATLEPAEKRQQRNTKNKLPARYKDGDVTDDRNDDDQGKRTNQLLGRCETSRTAKAVKKKKDKSMKSIKRKFEPQAQENASAKLLHLAETFQEDTDIELLFTKVSPKVIPSDSQVETDDRKIQDTKVSTMANKSESTASSHVVASVQEHEQMEIVDYEDMEQFDSHDGNKSTTKNPKVSIVDEVSLVQVNENPMVEDSENQVLSAKPIETNKAVDELASTEAAIIHDNNEMGVENAQRKINSAKPIVLRETELDVSVDAGEPALDSSALTEETKESSEKSSPLDKSNTSKKRARRPEKNYSNDAFVIVGTEKFHAKILRFYFKKACKVPTIKDVSKATIGYLKPKKDLLQQEIVGKVVFDVCRLVRHMIRDVDPESGLHSLDIMKYGEKQKVKLRNVGKRKKDKVSSDENLPDVNPSSSRDSSKKKILSSRTADNKRDTDPQHNQRRKFL